MGSPPCEWGRGAYSENENQTTLTHDFWMKQTEVTQAEWTAQGLPNPSATLDSGFGDCLDARCPVGNLTWFEALAFANKMSSTNALPECYSLNGCTGTLGTGMTCASAQSVEASLYACKGYRIPSEAEWEYAARAGTRSAFYAGGIAPLANTTDCEADPVLESIAWFCGIPDAGRTTHPVGLKLPNAWGLFDMSGNAIEPVSDPFEGLGYGSAARTDPFSRIALADASPTVPWRGGLAWTWSNLARSANRYQAGLGRGPGGGLRLVRRGD
ncbi:MAG: formylglycine-generating enzyme family protein [Myxococcales bacterium]|nr:formylglycine-generating enzyme family protein [Myxococcales bacterium]